MKSSFYVFLPILILVSFSICAFSSYPSSFYGKSIPVFHGPAHNLEYVDIEKVTAQYSGPDWVYFVQLHLSSPIKTLYFAKDGVNIQYQDEGDGKYLLGHIADYPETFQLSVDIMINSAPNGETCGTWDAWPDELVGK